MSPNPENEPQYDSLFRLLVERLYWFAIGPLLLILMLLGLLNDEAGRRVGYNVAYLVALAGIPVSRWLEMRGGRAVTADGKPATWTDVRNYVLLSVSVALVALVAANVYLIWSAS